MLLRTLPILTVALGFGACKGTAAGPGPAENAAGEVPAENVGLPLRSVVDLPLPGRPSRFDYQDIDRTRKRLVVAHMNDDEVVVVDLQNASVAKVVPNVPTARGIAVAENVARIFVTSSPSTLVILDAESLTEVQRVSTGLGPDGVAWDPTHGTVAVSDQRDGSVSLLRDAGLGLRTQIPLGLETGNVVFDPSRSSVWVTVVQSSGASELVQIDPERASVARRIPLPGCDGAHGLRLHPDDQSALVACEGNSLLARVDLGGGESIVTSPTGSGPDVLGVDPELGWLYVAAESGDLTVFDLNKAGLVAINRESIAPSAHSVAVDPSTHRVYFPLVAGSNGMPVLRVMEPTSVSR